MRNSMMLAAALVAVTTATAGAQGRGRNTNGVPPGQRPPDGMCRVWVNGVAPGRQSAPTDCATAQAQASVTANSRVIYGGHPGRKGATNRNDDGLLTRRRQVSDGMWVLDRYRTDANGNVTIVSTTPIRNTNKAAWKANKKADKQEMKAEKDRVKSERKADKRQDKIDDRAEKSGDKGDDRAENGGDNDLRTSLGASAAVGRGHSGGKGKGKH